MTEAVANKIFLMNSEENLSTIFRFNCRQLNNMKETKTFQVTWLLAVAALLTFEFPLGVMITSCP